MFLVQKEKSEDSPTFSFFKQDSGFFVRDVNQ